MNTQSKSSDPAQAARINLGIDENEVRREYELYRQFQFNLQKIISAFNSLEIGKKIDSLNDLNTAINQGGKSFLEDELLKLCGKEPKLGALPIQKKVLPGLLISEEKNEYKESFFRSVDDVNTMQSKNHFLIDEYFTIEGEKIILQDQKLQKYLQEKYTHIRTDPEDIKLHDVFVNYANASNAMRQYGLNLRTVGNYIEHTDTENSDFKPKFPFTPPWK